MALTFRHSMHTQKPPGILKSLVLSRGRFRLVTAAVKSIHHPLLIGQPGEKF